MTIRLNGASSSGLLFSCRIDSVEVDLGYGLESYSIPMYVADINITATNSVVLAFIYLNTEYLFPTRTNTRTNGSSKMLD